MILPSEEKFVLVQCSGKPINTHQGYCLKLFLLPLTNTPVSDYYVHDLVETSLFLTKSTSFKSLVDCQPLIKRIRKEYIGCGFDICSERIVPSNVFSQYRNIHKLELIYSKNNGLINNVFFNSLKAICEDNISEHFNSIIKEKQISSRDVVALKNCLHKSKQMDFNKRITYLEELSYFTKTKLSDKNRQNAVVDKEPA